MQKSPFKQPKFATILAVAAALGMAPASGLAQVTVSYAFNSGSTAASKTGPDAASVTAGNFAGSGAAAFSSSTDMAILRTDFTGADLTSALSDTDLFSFTLTANSGFLDLTSFTLNFGGSSTTAVGGYTSNIVIQSSIGGFGTGNPTLSVTPSNYAVAATGPGTPQLTGAVVDVSDSAFDNLSAITFQIRFFDNVDNVAAYDRFDNVVVEMGVIPEPTTIMMLLGGVGILLLRRRR